MRYLDPMRSGDGFSAESVAAIIASVVVVPLAIMSVVVVVRVCRRRHRHKQQQQQQQQQQARSAPQYPVTGMRLMSGADLGLLQRQRTFNLKSLSRKLILLYFL